MRSSLYVHRPLVNSDQLRKWATQQGFGSFIDPDDIHVTIAFSKRPLRWDNLEPNRDHLRVVGGDRTVESLGDRDAIVLRFEDPHLSDRWDEFCRAGADWEHPNFKPHITLTYKGGDLNPAGIDPYLGPLIFGPEEFSPVEEDWDQEIKEIPLLAENMGLLAGKRCQAIKYAESITEITRMTDFSSLLIKNIDLILEAYNLDRAGNLVVANSKKVREADEVFHQYFVKSMNQMFQQLNEADPIMQQPNSMGLPQHGVDNLGLGDEMMPDMGMMGMAHGHEDGDDPLGLGGGMGEHPMGDQMDHMHAGMGGGSMGAPGGGVGGSMGGAMGESTDYNWLNEDPDLDINSLFDLKEEDDEENEEDEHEKLDEFMMGHQDDEMMGGPMDHMGGANDMGGDMGGTGDDMELDSGMDHHDMMGGDEMGDDGDMVTVHGTTDNGADFEFSFDPNTLGFDDLEGGGGDMGGGENFGGHEEHGHEGGDMDHTDEPGFGSDEDEEPVAEAMVKKGKPGKGRGGPRTARMAVVPSNPAVGHAAPFPTPQGVRQKRK